MCRHRSLTLEVKKARFSVLRNVGVNLLLVFVDENLELDFVDVEMRLL